MRVVRARSGPRGDVQPVTDAAVPTDAAGHDARFSLGCGLTPCTKPTDACCFDRSANASYCARAMEECVPDASLRYICDDPDDCTALGMPGTVCCGTLALGGNSYFLEKTRCVTAVSCAARDDMRLCDPAQLDQCGVGVGCPILSQYPNASDTGTTPVTPEFPACAR